MHTFLIRAARLFALNAIFVFDLLHNDIQTWRTRSLLSWFCLNPWKTPCNNSSNVQFLLLLFLLYYIIMFYFRYSLFRSLVRSLPPALLFSCRLFRHTYKYKMIANDYIDVCTGIKMVWDGGGYCCSPSYRNPTIDWNGKIRFILIPLIRCVCVCV